MDAFKSALPADVVDPSSLGRIRNRIIISQILRPPRKPIFTSFYGWSVTHAF